MKTLHLSLLLFLLAGGAFAQDPPPPCSLPHRRILLFA
jgi:hypothetical protein